MLLDSFYKEIVINQSKSVFLLVVVCCSDSPRVEEVGDRLRYLGDEDVIVDT